MAAIDALRSDPWFRWIWSVRRATTVEDSWGIDAVVQSEIGCVWVQVKSKSREAGAFRKRARDRGYDVRDMAVIVANAKENNMINRVKSELLRVFEYRVGEGPKKAAHK